MSVTPEQHIEVLKQIADLRVHVETLTGKLEVTNERLNNTNDGLKALNLTLTKQAELASANRKWIVGTFLSTLAIVVAIALTIIKI